MGLRHRLKLTVPGASTSPNKNLKRKPRGDIGKQKEVALFKEVLKVEAKCELPEEFPKTAIGLMCLKGRHCRWPVHGEGADMMFCGAKRTEESSYCENHAKRARGKKGMDETSKENRRRNAPETNR